MISFHTIPQPRHLLTILPLDPAASAVHPHPMAQTQLQTLTTRHEAIAQYMLANPEAKKGEVARQFNVSASWLSVIINSDAFQAKLEEMQVELFSQALVPIADKVAALADLSLDRLIERVPTLQDDDTLLKIAEMALDRSGHGPAGPQALINAQNLTVMNVAADVVQSARQRIIERKGLTVDSSAEELPAPEVSSPGRTLENHP